MSPADHARACDCPGCSCVGVSRDYLRTMLEDDERRRARRERARRGAQLTAWAALAVVAMLCAVGDAVADAPNPAALLSVPGAFAAAWWAMWRSAVGAFPVPGDDARPTSRPLVVAVVLLLLAVIVS